MLLLSGRQALGQIANQESCLPNSFLILSPPRCSSSPVSLWFILCSSDLFLESVSVSSSCHNSASSLLFPIWTDFCFNHACYTSRRNLKYSKENSKKRSQDNHHDVFYLSETEVGFLSRVITPQTGEINLSLKNLIYIPPISYPCPRMLCQSFSLSQPQTDYGALWLACLTPRGPKSPFHYSWPLNNTGVQGADPHAVENSHIRFDSPKTLLRAYCWL